MLEKNVLAWELKGKTSNFNSKNGDAYIVINLYMYSFLYCVEQIDSSVNKEDNNRCLIN